MPVNTIDIVVLVIIGLSAVNGLQRGLMLGVIDMLTLGASILVGARLAPWSSGPIREWGLPDSLSAGFGFFVSAVVCYALLGLAARIVLAPILSFGSGSALAWVNGILGLIPGAIRGAMLASLMVIVTSALPSELGARQELATSHIAEPLATSGREALKAALQWSGVRAEDIGLPLNVLSVEATEPSEQLASLMPGSDNHQR
jgi:uncharacterized membrane protein required for colicin V production